MLFGPLLSFYGNDVVPLLFHKCQIMHINLLLVKSFVSGGLVIVITSSKGEEEEWRGRGKEVWFV